MIIRRAKKADFEDYFKMKKQEEKDYSVIIGEKVRYPRPFVKKTFNKAVSSRLKAILVAEEEKKLIGYLDVEFYTKPKKGYIEDLFVYKEYRNRGIATKLISEFKKILKEKKYKYMTLEVNIKNKNAQKLYGKLGFKAKSVGMLKRL